MRTVWIFPPFSRSKLLFSQFATSHRRSWYISLQESLTAPWNDRRRKPQHVFRRVRSSSRESSSFKEDNYHPEVDVEDFEEYAPGGYHPTLIGEKFCSGRYTVIHKLGFGGYSTIWLGRDHQLQRYVSLKILTARASRESREVDILRALLDGRPNHAGKQFIPQLLGHFSFDGPNGHHQCLVGEPAGCSVAKSKENSVNLMFPRDAARSITAQLVLGLSYLHECGVCHGDLHLNNVLLRIPNLDGLSTVDIYERYGRPHEVPIRRVDGKTGGPHAPPHAIYPMAFNMPANELAHPEIIISDYGTSFVIAQTASPILHTPALYSPPEVFFNEPILKPSAADIWTLSVNLYEVLGERPLFETFACDPDDIIAEMVNTLGLPPARWWNSWSKRSEFFEMDGTWVVDFRRISTPVFRRLSKRLWDMGRGETPDTCEWDVVDGELRALEVFLRAMMAFEPAKRLTADQLLESEYMVKWSIPAWERQKTEKSSRTAIEKS